MTVGSVLDVLKRWEADSKAYAEVVEVLRIYEAALQTLDKLDAIKAEKETLIDQLKQSAGVYQEKAEQYLQEFQSFAAQKDKERQEILTEIDELRELAATKRAEIATLEKDYEDKHNALFQETKEIERKRDEVKKSFEEFRTAHGLT